MLNLSSSIEVTDGPEYGVILSCSDSEVADELEDFLTEECFVLFQLKIEPSKVSFIFGQAASADKVAELCNLFLASRTA